MKIVFGTRGSALALAQTQHIITKCAAYVPELEAEIKIIKTTGDQLSQAPLSEIGGLGAFTREIEQALQSGRIDVAVHSLKDLPIEQPDGLYIAAIAERQSPSDVLISRKGYSLESLKRGALVGTSSLRRQTQLLLVRPDLHIGELRGNVPTRIAAVREGRFDAVVLAQAGLARLGLDQEPGLYEIPTAQMLPAPAQGALALEIRKDACDLARHLTPLHDHTAAAEVYCERAVLNAFGGGCRSPLGTRARCVEGHLHVEALAVDPETGRSVRLHNIGRIEDALTLGNELGAALRAGLRA